jgi:hypothetical protein
MLFAHKTKAHSAIIHTNVYCYMRSCQVYMPMVCVLLTTQMFCSLQTMCHTRNEKIACFYINIDVSTGICISNLSVAVDVNVTPNKHMVLLAHE